MIIDQVLSVVSREFMSVFLGEWDLAGILSSGLIIAFVLTITV